jgi:hypothetical protein
LKNVLILALIGVVVFSIFASLNGHPVQPTETVYVDEHKAAIVDGLSERAPNPTLIQKTVECLSDSGYNVDVYSGKNVTIRLLQDIGGYKILILRLHSVAWCGSLYLFSTEMYTSTDYALEQMAGEVTQASTYDLNEIHYFALNSAFLGKDKPKGMNGTTIMLMGCDGMTSQNALQAFSRRGVKTYISWDGFVDLSHSDEASLRLVKAIYTEGLSPNASVDEVNRQVGPDPYYKSRLVCGLP